MGGGIETVPALLRNNRYRRDPRQLDEEEEMWFNDDDDIEDGDGVVPASNSPEVLGRTKADADSQLESIGKLILNSVAPHNNVGCILNKTFVWQVNYLIRK